MTEQAPQKPKKDKNPGRTRRRALKRARNKKPVLIEVSPEVKAMVIGAPTQYEERFCAELIEHMKKGGSFESFGGVALVGRTTLYEWEAAHPPFAAAKKRGRELSLKFYEDMGRMIATGQVRFLKSEKPMVVKDKDGNEVLARDGQGNIVYLREWEPARTQVGAWAFMMKNIHHWKDQRNLAISGDGDGAPIKHQALPAPPPMTPAEKMEEFKRMSAFVEEMEQEKHLVIDVTPIK